MTIRDAVKPAEVEFDLELAEPVIPGQDPTAAADSKPAGRIVHDDRGNALWKWAGDTASTGTASGILKHLDPRDLKVVEGQVSESGGSGGATRTRASDAGGGYDPYNQDSPKLKGGAPRKGGPAKR